MSSSWDPIHRIRVPLDQISMVAGLGRRMQALCEACGARPRSGGCTSSVEAVCHVQSRSCVQSCKLQCSVLDEYAPAVLPSSGITRHSGVRLWMAATIQPAPPPASQLTGGSRAWYTRRRQTLGCQAAGLLLRLNPGRRLMVAPAADCRRSGRARWRWERSGCAGCPVAGPPAGTSSAQHEAAQLPPGRSAPLWA